MMAKGKQVSIQPGRLALRVEGDFWVAYFAKPHTMDGAIPLGSIRLGAVEAPERQHIFMKVMQEVMSDLIEQILGVRPTWPKPPEPAPEHERAGSA